MRVLASLLAPLRLADQRSNPNSDGAAGCGAGARAGGGAGGGGAGGAGAEPAAVGGRGRGRGPEPRRRQRASRSKAGSFATRRRPARRRWRSPRRSASAPAGWRVAGRPWPRWPVAAPSRRGARAWQVAGRRARAPGTPRRRQPDVRLQRRRLGAPDQARQAQNKARQPNTPTASLATLCQRMRDRLPIALYNPGGPRCPCRGPSLARTTGAAIVVRRFESLTRIRARPDARSRDPGGTPGADRLGGAEADRVRRLPQAGHDAGVCASSPTRSSSAPRPTIASSASRRREGCSTT